MDRPPEHQENLLHPLAKLAEWKEYSKMPIGMRDAQAVVLGDKIYLGGGDGSEGPLSTLLIYDFSNDSWEMLDTPTHSYSLTVYDSQLVLVGGVDPIHNTVSKELRVLDENHCWTTLLSMPTERFGASVVSVGIHLIVAGGDKGGTSGWLDVVEVYDGQQWRKVQPLPKACFRMKSVVNEGFWYLAGGVGQDKKVFYTSLESFIHTTHSEGDERERVWQTLPDAPLQNSTPAIFGKQLITVGGLHQSAIYVYTHRIKTWVRVGDLPVAYSFVCCLVLPITGELLMVGGKGRHGISSHVFKTKIQVTSFPLDKLTISALDRLEAVGSISLFDQLSQTPDLLAAMASALHLDEFNWVNARLMFKDWLSSPKSSLPPTWDTLCKVLPSIHSPLARKVDNFLKMTPGIPSVTASLELQKKLNAGRQPSPSTETKERQTKADFQEVKIQTCQTSPRPDHQDKNTQTNPDYCKVDMQTNQRPVGIQACSDCRDEDVQTYSVLQEVGIQVCPECQEVGIQVCPECQEVGIHACPHHQEVDIQTCSFSKEVGIQACPDRQEVGIQACSDYREVDIQTFPEVDRQTCQEAYMQVYPDCREVGIQVNLDYWGHTIPEPVDLDTKGHVGLDSEPKLQELMNTVAAEIPDQWMKVGIQLGLEPNVLKAIPQDGPRDSKDCFSEVFTLWRSQMTSQYTWRTIIKTLQTPAVGQKRLAEEISGKLP